MRDCDGQGLVHVALAPLSFMTWIAGPKAHWQLKIERTVVFIKKHGGIQGYTYNITNEDWKDYDIRTISSSPERYEV